MSKKLVEQLLTRNGPMLSSEITKQLVELGVSPDAARKQVQRGCSGMIRLSHIIFPHRARFIYLEGHYGSPYFFTALLDALEQSKSIYFSSLSVLIARGGAMPESLFAIACGAPIAQKGHVSAKQVVDRLEKAGLLKRVNVPAIGDCVVLISKERNLEFSNYSDLRAKLIVESITLKAIKEWSRNLGLVSYDRVKLRDDPDGLPKVGTFNWDMSGPSYVFPLTRPSGEGKLKSGFLVCDIALIEEISKGAVSAFVRKCVNLRHLKNVGSCLQIFVAESFHKEALGLLKQFGIVPATPDSLFGKDIADALLQLTTILTETARAVVDAEALEKIFQSLSKIEGATATLRGCLFEFMVAEIVRGAIPGCETEMNRIVKIPSGSSAEIDVVAVVKRKAVYFIECKGYSPIGYLDENEVDRWLAERIPTIRSYAKEHTEWKNLKQHFQLWSSGMLSPSAIAKVEGAQSKTNKYCIEIKGPDEVYSAAKETGDKSLLKTYAQHFINNPLREHERIEKRKLRQAQTIKKVVHTQVETSETDVKPAYDMVPPGLFEITTKRKFQKNDNAESMVDQRLPFLE